jgi:FkbM family methyltransferase
MSKNETNNNPLVIIDIGGRWGLNPIWEHYTQKKAILFEPDKNEYEQLKKNNDGNLVLNIALSEIPGDFDFHLCKNPANSSFHVPNHEILAKFPEIERFNHVDTIKIKVDNLDGQMKKEGITDVDFIKIDTEGHVLPILKGSQTVLERTIGLELELMFIPVYINQSMFSDVDPYVTARGFELFDMNRTYWKRKLEKNQKYDNGKGQIVYVDALYFKSPETVCGMPGITSDKIMKAVNVYLAYGYHYLACVLRELGSSKGLISSIHLKELDTLLLKTRSKNIIPDFKGKGRILNLFRFLSRVFSMKQWASADNYLGNTKH